MSELTPRERQVFDLVSTLGVVRVRDVAARGLHPEYLRRLVRKGHLVRVSRGVYAPADHRPSEQHGLVQVASRSPRAVICLLSALQFHELTTQMPRAVWIAVGPGMRPPQMEYPPLRIMKFSGPSFAEGWEEHILERVAVRIFTPAKTVADCFKFRNVIGPDVAIEALRESLAEHRASVDEIVKYARTCRVGRVIQPYLEAMV